jgi:hypothetical protein
MNKNELKLAEAQIEARKFDQKMALAKHTVTMGAGSGALWIIFDGLSRILFNQSATEIDAVARVLNVLNVGSLVGYVFGGGMFIAWRRERTGKKRAIREKSKYQKLAESGDPNRRSSGLTETGETPSEEG